MFGNATRLGEMLKNGLNWYMIHNGLFLHWMASDAWFKAFNFVGLIKIHVNGMSVIWDSIHQKFPPAQDVAIESLLWFCVLIKLCFPINAPCQKLGWCTNVSHAYGLDHVWSLKGAISDHFSLSLYHWPFNSHLGNPSLTFDCKLLLVLYNGLFFGWIENYIQSRRLFVGFFYRFGFWVLGHRPGMDRRSEIFALELAA